MSSYPYPLVLERPQATVVDLVWLEGQGFLNY
jgi:hypothetical protein